MEESAGTGTSHQPTGLHDLLLHRIVLDTANIIDGAHGGDNPIINAIQFSTGAFMQSSGILAHNLSMGGAGFF